MFEMEKRYLNGHDDIYQMKEGQSKDQASKMGRTGKEKELDAGCHVESTVLTSDVVAAVAAVVLPAAATPPPPSFRSVVVDGGAEVGVVELALLLLRTEAPSLLNLRHNSVMSSLFSFFSVMRFFNHLFSVSN